MIRPVDRRKARSLAGSLGVSVEVAVEVARLLREHRLVLAGQLMDSRQVRSELGLSEDTALRLMRLLPVQNTPGVRKSFVRRTDLWAYLEEHYDKREVAA